MIIFDNNMEDYELEEEFDCEPMSEEEFFIEYSNSDDLENYLEDEYINIEIEQTALLEAAMVDSYQLSEAQPGMVGNAMNNVKKEVKFQKNQIRKEINRKPVATNIFMRIFNVIRNAFGVVTTFMEKAMTTFKINNLYTKISNLPDSMRFETLKGFLDNTIDRGIQIMQNGAQSATRFLNNIFIVGRMDNNSTIENVFNKVTQAAHAVTGGISKVLTTSKRGVLKQLDSLKRSFQQYSQIKLIYRGFLTVMNACSDPRRLANVADKLMKTTTGQGIQGPGGVALDVLNKTVKKGNIMSNPTINAAVNNSCKIIGTLLSHYKKSINENLRCITKAYQQAVSDPKNRGAIKAYQNKASDYKI